MGRDGVVPFWQNTVRSNGELTEFGLCGLDAGWVDGGIQLCGHFQTGSCFGGADELECFFVTVQGLGGPVPADLAEQAVLDRIPFGGTGRVVTKRDAQAQAITQLTLDLLLPGSTLCAVTASSVGQDEDVAGPGVTLASFPQPPFAKTGDGEGGCFVGNSQKDRAAIGLRIVDAIGNGDAFGCGAEVMIVDRR